MRKIAIVLLVFFNYPSLAQETLINLSFTDNTRIGYGVYMTFLADDFDQIHLKIEKLDTISEASILKLFGTPLINPYGDYEGCVLGNSLYKENKDFLKHHKKITINQGKYTLKLEFSTVEIEYCSFNLRDRYWPYFVQFKIAAIITNFFSSKRPSKPDLVRIKDLKKQLNNKFGSLILVHN